MFRLKIKHLIYGFLLWFVIHESIIISDGLTDENQQSDVAVIFGNTVNEDGTLSDRLRARLDRGIKLYRDSLTEILFVSGGLGKEGFYEGDKMQEYLIEQGIPRERIIVDNQGNNTQQTVSHVLQRFGTEISVAVVSQYHHISRAKLAFRKAGVNKVSGAHAHYFEIRDGYSCIREFFGYYSYLLIN